jgi:hypothetical protein
MKYVVIALMVLFTTSAQADTDNQKINNQQLSKKPYAAPVVEDESFEGLVVEKEDTSDKQYKILNLHRLGSRPYAVKNTD